MDRHPRTVWPADAAASIDEFVSVGASGDLADPVVADCGATPAERLRWAAWDSADARRAAAESLFEFVGVLRS